MKLKVYFQLLAAPQMQSYGILEDGIITTASSHITLEKVKLLPAARPSKIIGVGKNYRDHAAEMGGEVPNEPLLFLKATSSVVGDQEAIILPSVSNHVDYEGELAIVIAQTTKNIDIADVASHIAGYTCANDVTARDFQKTDNQWTRAKGFDTFCPLGGFLYEGNLPPETRIETHLNGRLVQSAKITDMVFSPEYLVAYISRIMTLQAGDVILTGTPAGVGRLAPGDQVSVRLSGIAGLTNPVS